MLASPGTKACEQLWEVDRTVAQQMEAGIQTVDLEATISMCGQRVGRSWTTGTCIWKDGSVQRDDDRRL